MSKFIGFLYGLAAYLIFFVTFLYAIGFVEGMIVPKAIDTGAVVPVAEALIVNILLMSLFAVQHSVMARRQFKDWWTQFVPKPVERSTYVLLASLALALLFWQWRPMPTVVWQDANPGIANAIIGLSFIGWLLVLVSTFLINHFELFGLHQVANYLTGRDTPAMRFKTPMLYNFVHSDLSWLHHRVLGGTDDDGRTSAVRRRDHRLYLRWHLPRRTRSHRAFRR
jgi:protein-S-isoprenylcysteine O-methyltransferase Ste14